MNTVDEGDNLVEQLHTAKLATRQRVLEESHKTEDEDTDGDMADRDVYVINRISVFTSEPVN